MGVSPLHGLIAASLRINKIYIKIDKVKINPYLHHNHSLAKLPYLSTSSIYKSSLIPVNVISCILTCFALAIIEYRTQYFTYLWRLSYLSLRIHRRGRWTKPSNCSNRIKMPKSTTGCQIKSFIQVENMNVEKLRDT